MNLDSDDIQVYGSIAVTLIVWAALSVSGWSSLRWSRRSPDTRRLPRIVLAMLLVLLGLLCLKADIRWSGEDDRFTVDLSWFFLLPVALGAAALAKWLRVRRRLHHAA